MGRKMKRDWDLKSALHKGCDQIFDAFWLVGSPTAVALRERIHRGTGSIGFSFLQVICKLFIDSLQTMYIGPARLPQK